MERGRKRTRDTHRPWSLPHDLLCKAESASAFFEGSGRMVGSVHTWEAARVGPEAPARRVLPSGKI